jgi:hypothetical protein
MDPNIPNEDERRKLQKISVNFKISIINLIILSGIYWIVRYLLDKYPVIQIAIFITILMATFFVLLKMALSNKCPRCASWGTPIMGGNCPKCGLHFNPSYKER